MVHPMSDIRQWLEEHGLGKYEGLFTENEVDFEILPELTEPDLEKIGLALLSLVYESFTEGFDTPDLEDAKTLLEQLS